MLKFVSFMHGDNHYLWHQVIPGQEIEPRILHFIEIKWGEIQFE